MPAVPCPFLLPPSQVPLPTNSIQLRNSNYYVLSFKANSNSSFLQTSYDNKKGDSCYVFSLWMILCARILRRRLSLWLWHFFWLVPYFNILLKLNILDWTIKFFRLLYLKDCFLFRSASIGLSWALNVIFNKFLISLV